MRLIENVACTVCGCVCDDLRISVDGDRIIQAEGACVLAEPWFLEQGRKAPPRASIRGVGVSDEDAIARAVELLRHAKSPLIYGLSRSSTAGQRAAIALADFLGATIDTTASLCHAPSVMALQEVGESTCTLGEVKNRADLVIFWGADPAATHPRHLERYVPKRDFKRTIVVVDSEPTASSAVADEFLPIEIGRDFEALWTLRLLLQGRCPASGAGLGMPLATLERLLSLMKSCHYGIVFFGIGLSQSGVGHRSVEALLSLVTELNDHTRFYARRLRLQGDVTGADSVLAWQTGYPFSVNLARGYPRYEPHEYSAVPMLERGEPDICLFVGSETVLRFSEAALAHLRRIPIIALDHANVVSVPSPEVRFTTAIYGIHRPGTAYRMDEVPIPLREVMTSPYPADHEVLQAILVACAS